MSLWVRTSLVYSNISMQYESAHSGLPVPNRATAIACVWLFVMYSGFLFIQESFVTRKGIIITLFLLSLIIVELGRITVNSCYCTGLLYTCPYFKQWMRSSSEPSVSTEIPHFTARFGDYFIGSCWDWSPSSSHPFLFLTDYLEIATIIIILCVWVSYASVS